jgi:hypothetical protein
VLELSGSYLPDVYCLDTRINLAAPTRIGESFNGKLELFVNKHRNVAVQKVGIRGPLPADAKVLPGISVGDGAFEKVEILLSGVRPDAELPLIGSIDIHTSAPSLPVLTMPVHLFSTEVEQVHYSPDRIAFGVLKSGDKVNRIITFRILRKSGLRILKVENTSEGVSVELAPVRNSSEHDILQLRCICDASKIHDAFDRELLVRIGNDSTSKTYKIPMSAFVKSDNDENGGAP